MRSLTFVAAFIFSGLSTSLLAQTLDFQSSQLGDLAPLVSIPEALSQSVSPDTHGGMPNAEAPQTLNADSIEDEPELIFQSQGVKTEAPSVIAKYFEILTGKQLAVYGASEFNQQQDSSLLFFNTMGRDYRLAPGDVLKITLRGFQELDTTVKIGRDGNLTLNNLAPFNVTGFSISEVESRLLTILKLDDASASVFLSIDTSRLITVQVSGAVDAPRTLAVPAYTPLSRALAYAGGISDTGSLRNIILRNSDGTVTKVDFYEFLQSPMGANDPLVTDSSRIFIGDKGPTVAVTGFVARPGIYELEQNTAEIRVFNLLKLAGTTLIPPGAEIEALYFDEDGKSASRKLRLEDTITAGEAVHVRFIETRNTQTVTIRGAVLDEYSLATNEPISVFEVLRGGAVLTQSAVLNFALIVGGGEPSRAINLQKVLAGQDTTLPIGSVLYVFDQKDYQTLVAADPNSTNDPLVAELNRTASAELYVNGSRVAYLAPVEGEPISEVIQPFYTPSPRTHLEFALLEHASGGDTAVTAVSLREMLSPQNKDILRPGDRLFIFERAFFQNLLGSIATSKVNVTNSLDNKVNVTNSLDNGVAFATSILRHAEYTEVRIDGTVFSLIPHSTELKLDTLVDILGGLPREVISDLILITDQNSIIDPILAGISTTPKASIYSGSIIDLFSASFYQRLINEALLGGEVNISEKIFAAKPVRVYLDGNLKEILPSGPNAIMSPGLSRLLSSQAIYPLFGSLSTYDGLQKRWKIEAWKLNKIMAREYELSASGRLDLYKLDWVRNYLFVGEETQVDSTMSDPRLLIANLDLESKALNDILSNQAGTMPATKVNVENLNAIIASAKAISGAVQFPGRYPVAGQVRLSDFLYVAGGTLEGADPARIEITQFGNNNGVLEVSNRRTIDLTRIDADTVILSGTFSVSVPFLTNDAISGVITVTGEVERPGEYIFARNETLHDVLRRAGGLTDVAYPLGAVFQRVGIKSQQKSANIIMAEQVEQSILRIAQSGVESSSDQLNVVAALAQQLRAQEASGRMSINILQQDPSVPVFLQEGDLLTVPKRPSHVSIIGAVQRDTMAMYAPDKQAQAYFSDAGGLQRVADAKNAYILLPNGQSQPLVAQAIIAPGSVIVVPPNLDRLSLLGLTELVSRVLGNIASSILAINVVK
jgi:protein involved in polysaccharide export with SLBB domain